MTLDFKEENKNHRNCFAIRKVGKDVLIVLKNDDFLFVCECV